MWFRKEEMKRDTGDLSKQKFLINEVGRTSQTTCRETDIKITFYLLFESERSGEDFIVVVFLFSNHIHGYRSLFLRYFT